MVTPEAPDSGDPALASALNRDCHCISVDAEALESGLEAALGAAGLGRSVLEQRSQLFAASPVFLSRRHLEQMQQTIDAVERVVRHPAYREAVLATAPPVAHDDPGPLGAFLGYDFHVGLEGPRLIEINTNAGGALLHSHLARAQRACCQEVADLVMPGEDAAAPETAFIEMFRLEFARQRPDTALRSVAIVDDDPPSQFLHPEFLLFQRLFEQHGIAARVADPSELELRGDRLYLDGEPLDLVYNRLTDFYLEEPAHAALAAAYRQRGVVVTPHPHAHALYAHKANLVLLSDPERLRRWGLPAETLEVLAAGVPRTRRVEAADAERLWSGRRQLFFKPVAGHGSRGAYRGDKLTRRVWGEILRGDYVAQQIVPPSERRLKLGGEDLVLKLDIRCFVYAGHVQLLASRVYRGQTANLRTTGGGLASVFTTPAPRPAA
jgi:hypothetical protein